MRTIWPTNIAASAQMAEYRHFRRITQPPTGEYHEPRSFTMTPADAAIHFALWPSRASRCRGLAEIGRLRIRTLLRQVSISDAPRRRLYAPPPESRLAGGARAKKKARAIAIARASPVIMATASDVAFQSRPNGRSASRTARQRHGAHRRIIAISHQPSIVTE